jgi:hypothetical protein
MFSFNEFISEKYNFQRAASTMPNEVKYTFRNKKGVLFEVNFWLKSFFSEEIDDKEIDSWIREYKVVDNKFKYFDEINQGDAFSIVKTVTDITIDFINKYKPAKIIIEHIPSEKECEKLGIVYDANNPIWKKHMTNRAKINKRFLERYLPKIYDYKLRGLFSIITRRN